MSLLPVRIPPFDVDGGTGLALVRFAFDAALCGQFGARLFVAVLLGPALARRPAPERAAIGRAPRRFGTACGLAALGSGLAWGIAEARAMADAPDLAAWRAAIGPALLDTRFGHLLTAQLALLAAGVALRRATAPSLAAAAAALALQAAHGHAASMPAMPAMPAMPSMPSMPGMGAAGWLPAASAIHLLAAGAWLGGLPPLLLTLGRAPPALAATIASSFARIGAPCVALLAATALLQGIVLIGSFAALSGTAYGWMALCKGVLFAALVALALLNRFRLVPHLGSGRGAGLRASVAIETLLGASVIAAAAILSALPPGIHTAPIRPFGP